MQAIVKGLGALSKRVYIGREKGGLGLRDGVSSSDLVWVIFCTILLALSNVESYSLCSDPLVSL